VASEKPYSAWPDLNRGTVYTDKPPVTDLPAHYARYVAPVRAKCRRLLGETSAAEDAAQETFVRLLSAGLRLDEEPRVVLAWLYRTGTRISIDMLRDRRRRRIDLVSSSDEVPCGADPRAALAARSALARIADATPDDELAAAVLCRVDALTQPEAAAVMNVSERTVRRLLDRFDERLTTEHS
jgi:RNA polymerase sigma-70 factor (ECF subfamily)